MCGICGFVGAGAVEDLDRMSLLLQHRGPDDCGTWTSTDDAVSLASRRLAVTDLPGGHQPMLTPEGDLVIVFNGEIYNHRELRQELQQCGHHFSSNHSDTEVLLFGYREWGARLPERLNGMWAFTIYDKTRRLLFCSRDRFGKKPFFYANAREAFVFASELTSLAAHPGVDRAISRTALRKYFGYGYIPSPWSILEGVFKLPGGHSLWLDVRTRELRIEKYWDLVLDPFTTIPRRPEEEWGEQLRDLLDRAVQRRLVADVPVGVFLSGGIDSSAVTAFAARHVAQGSLKTFSIGFQERSFDETEFGRQVSAKFQTDHYVETLSAERALALIDECVTRLDEPMGDSSLLPTYLVSGLARQHVTVALGGDGGDELFAGYDPFLALRKAQWYRKMFPRPIHAAIKAIFDRLPVSHANMALDFKIKRALRGLSYDPPLWMAAWMAPIDAGSLAELLGDPVDMEELYAEAIEAWESCPQTDLVDKTLQFYAKIYLQDDILVKVDRASMMHSLEARAPFLDIDLVNFARRIPSGYKFRNGTTKYLLKKALEGVLPQDILYRKKKGFGVPVAHWFKSGELQPEHGRLGTLNQEVIRAKLAAHRRGNSDESAFLWSVFVLNKWAESTRVTA
jgi:asparagine synthase (glutamine-hydrolysing)